MGIDDTSNFTEWPHVVCRAMTVLSTISNPVVFLAFSETFRDVLCNAFRNVTFIYRAGRQSLARSNQIVPTTSKAQQKVCDTALELKSVSKVCTLESEQTILENNCITSPCWTCYTKFTQYYQISLPYYSKLCFFLFYKNVKRTEYKINKKVKRYP